MQPTAAICRWSRTRKDSKSAAWQVIMLGVRLPGPGRRHAGPRHAMAALDGITGAHVDWPDFKGLNQWKRKALELAEERSQLG